MRFCEMGEEIAALLFADEYMDLDCADEVTGGHSANQVDA
jgi:hypothetical protein